MIRLINILNNISTSRKKVSKLRKKYGLVDKRDIITVYDSLSKDNLPENPKIYLSSKNDDSQEYKFVESLSKWINKTILIYDISEEAWVINLEDKDKITVYNVGGIYRNIVEELNLSKSYVSKLFNKGKILFMDFLEKNEYNKEIE